MGKGSERNFVYYEILIIITSDIENVNLYGNLKEWTLPL